MMRTVFSFIILLCSVLSVAQSGSVVMNWQGLKADQLGAISMAYPDCGPLCYLEKQQLVHVNSIQVDAQVEPSSLRVANVVSTVITDGDLGDLSVGAIPEGLQVNLKNALSRKRNYAQLYISPIYKENGVLRQLQSLDYTYGFVEMQIPTKSTTYGNSLLSSGSWYRFKVNKTGVHRITRGFLTNLGIDLNGVDPRTIKIYGNGGPSLPLINQETVAYDPPELAITVTGEADGVFNSGDEILFYATAANTEYVPENDSFINPYTDDSYYYITVNGGFGKRILPKIQPSGSPDVTYDYFHARQHHEVDERNIGQLGRLWYGERFGFEPTQTFDFQFENVDTSRDALCKVTAAGISDLTSSMQVQANGAMVGTMIFNGIASSSSVLGRRGSVQSSAVPLTGNSISVTLSFDNLGNPGAQGFLDYIELEVPQFLRGTGDQFRFRNNEVVTQLGIAAYSFTNAQDISEVWDVTDPFNVTKISNNQGAAFTFQDTAGELKEYLAIDDSDYYTPIATSNRRVANQNLKGSIFLNAAGQFEDVDYLIITQEVLRAQAQRLADFHRASNGLNTKVVLLQDIYNEFSEGEQDLAAIRNFIKYVYDNASMPENRVKYVNLFGDASFDYKDRISIRENIVPSFLSAESTSLTNSYVTDDFFGCMDALEGSMDRTNLLDIAVGRMIVSDLVEARQMVDKSIAYQNEAAFNRWRNDVYLIGDDIDDPQVDATLQVNVNDLADQISLNRPDYNVFKIILDSYQQVSTAGGFRYPDAVDDIKNAFERGALVINYFGHGNEDGLAQEFVVTQTLADNLRNPNNLPLFVTVTCEFSRYDNPLRVSGGEVIYLNEQGGAIGLVATNRLIFITTGVTLNRTLDQYLFNYNNPTAISMAEALRLAKTDPALSGNVTRRVVAFIGDPALKLALPSPQVVLTEVNGTPLANFNNTLRGLDRVNLVGEVRDEQNNLLSNYNGVVSVTLFDKQIDRTTLGNDNARDTNGQLILLNFEQLGEVLFRGQATVTNGLFEVEFVMPRDTQIPVGAGRLSFYAKRADQPQDNNGYNVDLQVGGINTAAPTDDVGPQVDLYMNDTNFVSGGMTDENPFILALLSDDNGINTASGIGHDITAILDGDEVNPFILNDYYEADVDSFQSGRVYFPLRDLEPGLHTLKLIAWDTYNNSAMQEIQFVVAGDDKIKLERVLNYPNPFTNYTEFWFNHNKPFEPLEVQVQVMTVTGKVVWSTNRSITTTGFTSREITWDGRDDFGQRLAKGVYIYKIRVKSTLSNQEAEKIEKLVIL
jgi:hypothetical protein